MMRSVLKALRYAPWSAQLGLFIIAVNVSLMIGAPVFTPFPETEVVGDVWETGFWADDCTEEGIENFACWDELNKDREHKVYLGTDHLGRDLFSRLLYGARNTISIALATTAVSFSIGISVGFLAATLRGWVDQALSRFVDVLMAFPTLIFALMILSVVGTSVGVLIVVIAVLDSTRVYRLSRAVAMDVEVMEFVEVARLRGEGLWWLMRREILPNTLPPLVAEFGLRFCFVFLFLSALSFLGLGLQPPTAGLGEHGEGERRGDHVWHLHAAGARGCHRHLDHRRQSGGGLVPAQGGGTARRVLIVRWLGCLAARSDAGRAGATNSASTGN